MEKQGLAQAAMHTGNIKREGVRMRTPGRTCVLNLGARRRPSPLIQRSGVRMCGQDQLTQTTSRLTMPDVMTRAALCRPLVNGARKDPGRTVTVPNQTKLPPYRTPWYLTRAAHAR